MTTRAVAAVCVWLVLDGAAEAQRVEPCPQNSPLTAVDTYTTPHNTTLVVSAAQGVLANDVSSTPMTASLLGLPSNGAATVASDGGFTYIPDSGYSGSAQFFYGATNATGLCRGQAIIQVGYPTDTLGAPTNFAINAVTGNTVSLGWTPPFGGVAPTSYTIEGGLTPGSIAASLPTGSTAPGATFTAPTGAFYVRVRAHANGMTSAPSNEVLLYVNVPAPPAAPTNLLGLASGSFLHLAWANGLSGGVPSAMLLNVSGPLNLTLPIPTGDTFEFPAVPPGDYTFTVSATNAAGTSAPSNEKFLSFPSTCPGPPFAPSTLVATRTGNVLRVSWGLPEFGPSPASYRLEVSGAFVGVLPLNARSISGAVGSGSYTFRVSGVNVCGIGTPTEPITVVVP